MKSMIDIVLTEKKTLLTRLLAYILYQKAFPKEEKKPYRVIRRCEKLGIGRNFIIKSASGRFLGIAYTLTNGKHVLLDYFAIQKNKRGLGVGAKALADLREIFAPLPIMLEIEDPELPCENREQRQKRKEFYLRCGMKMMDYRISLFGVDMRILTTGETIEYETYRDLLLEVLGEYVTNHVELLM